MILITHKRNIALDYYIMNRRNQKGKLKYNNQNIKSKNDMAEREKNDIIRYYTPNLEDLFIGYECEVNCCAEYDMILPDLMHLLENIQEGTDCFGKTTIKDGRHLKIISDLLHPEIIRVPYLTQEDIKSLGWVYETNVGDFLKEFDDGYLQYGLEYNFESHILKIEKIVNSGVIGCIYNGFCPSINELKYISKLLGI